MEKISTGGADSRQAPAPKPFTTGIPYTETPWWEWWERIHSHQTPTNFLPPGADSRRLKPTQDERREGEGCCGKCLFSRGLCREVLGKRGVPKVGLEPTHTCVYRILSQIFPSPKAFQANNLRQSVGALPPNSHQPRFTRPGAPWYSLLCVARLCPKNLGEDHGFVHFLSQRG